MSRWGKNKTKFKFRIFIILILIYFAIRAFPSGTFGEVKTSVFKEEEIKDSISAEAVIIKNEHIYKAVNNGRFKRIAEEGSRVSAGTEVASLTSLDGDATLDEELKQVEQSIEEVQKLGEVSADIEDISDMESLKSKLKDEIQVKIKDDNIENIYFLKERLLSLNRTDVEGNESIELDTLERLNNKKEDLIARISDHNKKYYIPDAGMISYRLDGFEEYYESSDFERYTYEYLDEEKIKEFPGNENVEEDSYQVKVEEPVFKWIDNFEWYLGIKIDDIKNIKELEENSVVEIMIDDGCELSGRVININKFKNKGVIIARFTSKLHEYYDERFLELELINSKVKGFKIPKDCVFERDGKKGIYIIDFSGVVRYRPVYIIGEKDKNYYIKSGDKDGNITMDDKIIKTLTEFDEVILKPKGVREGKLIE